TRDFTFSFYLVYSDVHSFPTRRSSDLESSLIPSSTSGSWPKQRALVASVSVADMATLYSLIPCSSQRPSEPSAVGAAVHLQPSRSEEHTSELQSRFDLVCRLLLEKKKQ